MERRWHSAKEVKEMTGVSYSNQHKLIKRWLERNCTVISLLCLRGSKIKIPEEVRAYIASPQQLLMQRHMSLEQRAAYWREKLQLSKLSPWLIR